MIWLLVKVVLSIQESESDTSDLGVESCHAPITENDRLVAYTHFTYLYCLHIFISVPLDLSYLPEHEALPSVFEVLKEEANVAGKSSRCTNCMNPLVHSSRHNRR